jgi:phage-related tail protein
MSETDPEVLRAEIARTRAELSGNVDALTETANPKNIADRQVTKVKSAARGVREHLMGAPDDPDDSGAVGDRVGAVTDRASGALGSVQDRASGAVDTVTEAPRQLQRKARGNPLAAGLIAFGIGYLISGAIPASEKEQEVASRLQDKAAPLTDKISEAASEVGERLREPAQQAATAVKDAASDAVATVKDQGATAKDDVQGQVQDSAATIKDSRTTP